MAIRVDKNIHNIHVNHKHDYLVYTNTSTWMLWILVYTYCHVMVLKLPDYVHGIITLFINNGCLNE